MEYLLTGGAGFIGSNIARRLVALGKKVRILDDFSTGRDSNLAGIEGGVELIRGSILDPAAVARAVDGVRYVFHLAALPSVIRSVKDPVSSNGVNVGGLLNVLVASRDAGVERLIFSSSSSVYGNTPVLPKREDMVPVPLSPYAVQKLAGEHYCRIFNSLYGLKTFCLRYFNVFGPYQDPCSQYAAVIPLFIGAIKSGRRPVIYGDGEQTRDFTYVDNVVEANISCISANERGAGGVYNIACGERISVNRLAVSLCRVIGKDVKPVYEAVRPGDVRDSQADSGRAREFLNWKPVVGFEEGIRRTVEYFLSI